ncbi:MAG: ABC transporter permease [Lachnospiraceae bacterium]|nr:ABC transporter permease [Lachnospiraceae bacterium]
MKKGNIKSKILPIATMISPVTLWLMILIVIPFIYVMVISFCKVDSNYNIVFEFTLKNYKNMLDPSYLQIYGNSLLIAFLTTLICLFLGYPFAFFISRVFEKQKAILYMIVIVPFWTNSLIRIYGWRTFLGANGWLNKAIMAIGISHEPVEFLFTRGAVILGMVYALFPFMVLPLYTAIEKLDQNLLEASSDLGAKNFKTLIHVILPLTTSGIFSGAIMVFIPTLGFFFVSNILGGGNSQMIGNLIERQFQSGNNWPLGAALSIVLIMITLLLVRVYQKLGGDLESLGV